MNENRNKYFLINLTASVLASVLSYGMNFFLTPYMVQSAGSEAYGFVSLANQMVNYASVVTVALNSVAGRFITIKIHEGKEHEANAYFNSVFWGNVILSAAFLLVSLPLVWKLEFWINIPDELTGSVKLLFLFVILNFLITVVANVFSVAAFVRNMLYLGSIGNFLSAVLRILLLAGLFGACSANIAYIGMSAAFCSFALAAYNAAVTRRLLPGIRISRSSISLAGIKEMLSAGIWSSVTKLSQVLSDGLDLLICNLGISSYAMGQLSIAYTVPTILSGVLGMIAALFQPQQTYYYARGETGLVIRELKTNMKLSGFFVSILFAGIVAYGYEFFCLWVPGEDIGMIYALSCISIVSVLASGATGALNSVFLLTNHLKTNSLVWLWASCLEAAVVILLVRFTDLGVYAVAGVSKVAGLALNFTYTPVYASKCLNVPKKTFYPILTAYMLDSVLMLALFFGLKQMLFPVNGLFAFVADCAALGAAGCVLNYYFFLNKEDRARMKQVFLKRKECG